MASSCFLFFSSSIKVGVGPRQKLSSLPFFVSSSSCDEDHKKSSVAKKVGKDGRNCLSHIVPLADHPMCQTELPIYCRNHAHLCFVIFSFSAGGRTSRASLQIQKPRSCVPTIESISLAWRGVARVLQTNFLLSSYGKLCSLLLLLLLLLTLLKTEVTIFRNLRRGQKKKKTRNKTSPLFLFL